MFSGLGKSATPREMGGKMKRTAMITPVKCMRSGKYFEIRWEQLGVRMWEATWSYKVSPPAPGTGGSFVSGGRISGKLKISNQFPGCPYCGGKVLTECSRCHQIYCHDIREGIHTKCPWDGAEGTIETGDGETEIGCDKDAHKN